jgi:ATP-dependent RNA helicase DDX46/PRP5
VQIAKEVTKFGRVLDLYCCPVFGGSEIKDQIKNLKAGVHVVVCTPGRMIDLLVTSNGNITNVRRVTMLVIDEADRMLDMGFEPQISRIIQNIRPDRQTVMFSATFPHSVESLAREILDNPIEVQVGGRTVVNNDIAQFVEIRDGDQARLGRVLELLAAFHETGKVLLFVSSQEKSIRCSAAVEYTEQGAHGAQQVRYSAGNKNHV